MPWSSSYYPAAMRRLPPLLRSKAIEIANALLAEGYGEGQAIRMAIAASKRWAAHRWYLGATADGSSASRRTSRATWLAGRRP